MASARKKRKGSLSLSSSNSAVGRKRPHRPGDLPGREGSGVRDELGGKNKVKPRLRGDARKVATAPSSCNGSSPGVCVRGLKRKSGCVAETATGDAQGRRLEEEYVVGKAIGQGRFGSVRTCWSRETGEVHACKTLLKNAGETVQREVEIMQHLSGHAGVVMLEAVFEDQDCFHLVMEMCSGGRLLDQMAKEGIYTEHRAANIVKELVGIIGYCHEMGVVHRDVKPENILLSASGEMKLADFGLAMRFTRGQQLSGFAGTPAYVAPEVRSGHYSEKVDIWSAGILLHALLVGVVPFQGSSREAILKAVENTELDFDSGIWEPISDLARDLVKHMLHRDPSSRMTADQVLNHPWVQFYTAQPRKMVFNNPKARDGYIIRRSRSEEITGKESSCQVRSSVHGDSGMKENKTEEAGFADMLAAAINRIRISEPKRIRLCTPASPIRQECSSNLQSNLLAAF